MSLPSAASTNPLSRAQPTIKSFFQPRQPNYTPPPVTPASKKLDDTRQSPTSTPASPVTAPAQPAATVETPGIPPAEAATPRKPSTIPSQATIRAVTEKDIPAFRRINALLLPVNYPDAFYRRVLDPAESAPFSRVITWADPTSPLSTEPKVVGGVVCRVDPVARDDRNRSAEPERALYIQSLCLLSPYRSLGLAVAALDDVIADAAASPTLNVRHVYAHVWTENEDGLRWYQARGFQRDEKPVENYYFKLRPGSAWIVRRSLVLPAVRSAMAGGGGAVAGTAASPTTAAVGNSTVAAAANLPPLADAILQASSGSGKPGPPSRMGSGESFQNKRADMEWNDLPADMAPGLLAPPRSQGGSSASSRSSSTARKKKDRAYPTAAFGGPGRS